MVITSRPRRRQTLAGELLVWQLAIVVIVLAAVAAVSLSQSKATFDRVEGRRVTALAEEMAGNPLVRTQLVRPAPAEMLAPLLQSTLTRSGVTSATVADARGRIVASTNPTLLGTRLPVSGKDATEGRGWSGELPVNGITELVAQAPVLGAGDRNAGDHLGTVMIGRASPTVWQRLMGASSYLLVYLGVASVLGVAGSWLLARRIKRQTFGMEPREIAGLAEHREAMLFGIAEGVVALDPQLRLTLVNAVGRRLLDLPESCVGMSLTDLGIEGRLYDVLAGSAGKDEPRAKRRDEVVVRRGRVLVMNRMDVTKDGRRLGSVTTLRDRTELAQLERELGSFRSTTELLRAQAHEFSNQLHTISGLIQIGEHDEVVRYVRALRKHRESLDLHLTSRVRDRAVAALLMAKSALAAERKVRLKISERTALERLEPTDSADVATVLGNLVDNAVDAAAAGDDGHDAWVEVELRQDASSVEIVVRDSGPGVAPELAQEVFSHGFTTKAAQGGDRGIGLALTRLVCKRRGGEVSVANTQAGAMFTARMSVGRPADRATEGVR
ncbi:Spo0B domain-containing protein [Streptomyces sp. ISL-22]|uniref:sensor histidine kinase n=1 Tax=unclassified Streptomyces TaxID=2593676 RepID=UPI001BE89821|nr:MULTISPECIES: ATP-binding protein [unclassified Streptomyces]MBT2420069.1 Spo0B domain-containing protein [Streptomyces sp. ISL-24]MBT2433943.1 Spo0B domain-containing protein [Streptomyces sp. ISL-22]